MDNKNNNNITILCSGVALGVYIPALIINNQLEKHYDTEIFVLENLLFKEKKDKIPQSKIAFHRNFRVALTGQKLARDIFPDIDPELLNIQFEEWHTEKRKKFIVFSGYWIPVLEEYMKKYPHLDCSIDLCHLDSEKSTSFKHYDASSPAYRHIWFFNWENRNVPFRIQVSRDDPIPYNKRSNRCVIHGGGWGMGTYKEKIPFINKEGIALDIITYEGKDHEENPGQNRFFMIDPEWNPWEKNSKGSFQFPPFGSVVKDKKTVFARRKEYPELYSLILQSKAIISKPGGSTLVDSLSSGTPLIFLEPFGEYENKNGLLWEHCGFGIPFHKWIERGCSFSLLEELHYNIIDKKKSIPEYLEEFHASQN